jgi:hypothetical protein
MSFVERTEEYRSTTDGGSFLDKWHSRSVLTPHGLLTIKIDGSDGEYTTTTGEAETARLTTDRRRDMP